MYTIHELRAAVNHCLAEEECVRQTILVRNREAKRIDVDRIGDTQSYYVQAFTSPSASVCYKVDLTGGPGEHRVYRLSFIEA